MTSAMSSPMSPRTRGTALFCRRRSLNRLSAGFLDGLALVVTEPGELKPVAEAGAVTKDCAHLQDPVRVGQSEFERGAVELLEIRRNHDADAAFGDVPDAAGPLVRLVIDGDGVETDVELEFEPLNGFLAGSHGVVRRVHYCSPARVKVFHIYQRFTSGQFPNWAEGGTVLPRGWICATEQNRTAAPWLKPHIESRLSWA